MPPTDPEPAPQGRIWAAAAGVLAAAAALAVSELLAGMFAAVPSLVLAVGSAVIDSVPGWVERHAIAILGRADKPALVIGILVLTAAAGAGIGILGARSRGWVLSGIALFGLVGAAAGATYRDSDPAAATAAAMGAAAAALAVLLVLLRRLPQHDVADRTEERQGKVGEVAKMSGTHDRRAFLTAGGAVAVVAAAAVVTGRWLGDRTAAVAQRVSTVLPRAPDPVDIPATADLEIEGLTPYVVPNEDFYRIDTALRVPVVDPATWTLAIDGFVDEPYQLTYEELLAMPQTEQVITLSCVSNEVGDGLVGNAVWQGVRLRDLLDRAGVQPRGTQLVGRSVDEFTAGFADIAIATLRPGRPSRWSAYGFAAAVAVVLWVGHFAALAATRGLGWPPELWGGATVLSALTAIGMAVLVFPPTVPAPASAAGDRLPMT